MTDRERLIELINQGMDCKKAGIVPERLADYLLTNGVCFKLVIKKAECRSDSRQTIKK